MCGLALAFGLGGWLSAQYLTGTTRPAAAQSPLPAKPAFRLADTAGQYRELREWRGQVVVVNFWATWCAPCLQEIPEFVQIQDAYRARGVQFVGIALDAPDAVMRFVDKLGITYPVLIGTTDAITAAQQFGNSLGVLPYTAVIDRSGSVAQIRAGLFHGDDLRATLDKLIAEPSATAVDSG